MRTLIGSKTKMFCLQATILLLAFSFADARVLWYGDPNRPLTASFRTLNRESGEAGTARAVDDPVHGKIWRVNKPAGSKRAEFARTTGSVNHYNIKDGDRVYVGWRVKVNVAGSRKPNGGFAIFQLKTRGNLLQNHPVSIGYDASRKMLNLQGINPGTGFVSPRKFTFTEHPMNEDTWTTIVLGFKFSKAYKKDKVGFVEAWINGVKQDLIDQNSRQQSYHRTHEEGYMYFKWGAYNETSRNFNITVDMGDMRVGTTLASVMNHLGGNVITPPPPPTYTLNTSVTGQGTVARSPNKTNYNSGEVVSLTANPASGWAFGSWSGAVSGTNNPVNVTMSQNRNVTATFTQIPTNFTLTTNIAGQGTVAKSPERAQYDPGATVTLTATPATGMVFTGWSGDATGTTNPLTVTMDQNRTVNALFTQAMPSGIEKLSIVASEASAEQNDDHLKELSYDGNLETRWANDNTPENNWIIYDLGQSGVVNAVKLMLNVGETRTYPLKIEVGENEDNFTEVWSGDLPPTIGLHTIVVAESTGRFVRMSMTGPNSSENHWFSIFQAEIWGTIDNTSIRSVANGYTLNPSINAIHGGFTVTAPGASAKLEVFNLQGKLLLQKSGAFENSFIPMRQNGVYFLRLSQGERQINQRLIIQN